MMKITSLERQQKDPRRWSVYIDGEFRFGLDEMDVYRLGISVGQELDEAALSKLLYEVQVQKAKFTLLNLLSYGARTEKQLRQKLREKGFEPSVIDTAIEGVRALGYIDDRAYVEAYVRYAKEQKKHGIFRIRQDLMQKGVEKALLDELLSEEEADPEVLKELIQKKLGKDSLSDPKVKNRITGFCLRRGFSYGEIREAIAALGEENEVFWEEM